VVEEAFSDVDSATAVYKVWFEGLNPQEQDSLLTDLATFITRKPATAQTISKFDAQFRSFYIKKRGELEFLYASKIEGKVHFYVLREARDANGAQQRGVGGVYRYDDQGNLVDFEELFNTRILPKNELERIGLTYMKVHNDEKLLTEFIANKTNIEWPDGRLFYSKEKHEWRYVE